MSEGQLREVLPGILTWSWFSARHGYDFNGYLFVGAEGNLAVDPVEMTEPALEDLARRGVSRIILTNRNHSRASKRLAERTGARVSIHPADANHARKEGAVIDDDLAIGALVGPFTVVDAAGKSPGEIALYSAERGMLVVGDACVGKPRGELALLPAAVIDDVGRLQQSLARLARELDFDVLLPGDGAPILTGARAALRRLVATFA